jgi:hypothetical protein
MPSLLITYCGFQIQVWALHYGKSLLQRVLLVHSCQGTQQMSHWTTHYSSSTLSLSTLDFLHSGASRGEETDRVNYPDQEEGIGLLQHNEAGSNTREAQALILLVLSYHVIERICNQAERHMIIKGSDLHEWMKVLVISLSNPPRPAKMIVADGAVRGLNGKWRRERTTISCDLQIYCSNISACFSPQEGRSTETMMELLLNPR